MLPSTKNNPLKIERGILVTDDELRLMVHSVGCIHRINYATFLYDQSNVCDKVLGVVENNLYNICYNFTVKNNPENIFGFIVIDGMNTYFLVQTIEGFNPFNLSNDFYIKDYNTGAKVKIERDEIVKVVAASY